MIGIIILSVIVVVYMPLAIVAHKMLNSVDKSVKKGTWLVALFISIGVVTYVTIFAALAISTVI